MSKVISSVDKVYRLKIGNPLSYTLASRNHPRFPLMWFDEKNNQNRALRYSINQKSPFEDEQDGNAIIEPIIFEDGFLRVPRTNPVLQQFLFYHPLNGNIFVEETNNGRILFGNKKTAIWSYVERIDETKLSIFNCRC